MATKFITFGGGSDDYRASVARLVNQAEQSRLFDQVEGVTDCDLKQDAEFWDRNGAFVESNPRGLGYWLWKPYVIYKCLTTLERGDVLLYLDSGCELDFTDTWKMEQLAAELRKTPKDRIICTHTRFAEKDWCKRDVFQALGMDHPRYRKSLQWQAGLVSYFVCPEVVSFVRCWYEAGCNYHLIDDTPSEAPNIKGFREHRHDQSLFSLLARRARYLPPDNKLMALVDVVRNRGGKTVHKAQLLPPEVPRTRTTARFLTFGGGQQIFHEAIKRLAGQAEDTGLFTSVIAATESDLYQTPFWEVHKDFVEANSRGFGYWLWKPYLIHKTLSEMAEGEVLLYLDAGCEINTKCSRQRAWLHYLIESVHEWGMVWNPNPIELERKWNKRALLEYMDMATRKWTATYMREAGALLFHNCRRVREFVAEWYRIACNYHFLDDSPSSQGEGKNFVEHRHDQSIFSLLSKKQGFHCPHAIRAAVDYNRNRTGQSRFELYQEPMVKLEFYDMQGRLPSHGDRVRYVVVDPQKPDGFDLKTATVRYYWQAGAESQPYDPESPLAPPDAEEPYELYFECGVVCGRVPHGPQISDESVRVLWVPIDTLAACIFS